MRVQSSPFKIRPATTRDVERLSDFAREFLAKMHPGAGSKDAGQVFQHVIRNHTGILLVAEHADGLCAYTYASYLWRSEFGGETMNLVELFVEQAWRKKGVGASLIAALLEDARRRGIKRLSAEVHPGNSAIERMLETAGFDPEHRTVWGLQI